MNTMNRLGRWVSLGMWLLGGVWGVQGQGNLATSLDMNGNFLRIVGTQAAPFPGEAVQEGVVGQHAVQFNGVTSKPLTFVLGRQRAHIQTFNK